MCWARCGGPRIPSRTTNANLDCVLVKYTLIFIAPKIEVAWALLGPPFMTPLLKGFFHTISIFDHLRHWQIVGQ